MPRIEVVVSCPVFDSFRVRQVAGMFDVPMAERVDERFQVEVPELGEDWRIGLVTGPSGSGKSTIARKLFGDNVYVPREWPPDKAVVDCLGDRPIRQITGLLMAVGFSSPPGWIKPYHVLSTGEQFRCDLARALAGAEAGGGGLPGGDEACLSTDRGIGNPSSHEPQPLTPDPSPARGEGNSESPATRGPITNRTYRGEGGMEAAGTRGPIANRTYRGEGGIVVFDEFTSVVDRNVARIVSAAIAKGIRGGLIGGRFVAVTCHYDVAEWLAPDWVIDMATRQFQWRCLPRPPIRLEVFRCERNAWTLFARHHYLSGALARGARCYLATWEGVPVDFCATVHLIGANHRWRFTRIVTLPDYQGVGIGTAVTEAVGDLYRDAGERISLTTSHPAMIAHCRRSPKWRASRLWKTGGNRADHLRGNYRASSGRAVVSFEYVGSVSIGCEL